jgi:archaellum biogenesis protein FlaJ (TadC family)
MGILRNIGYVFGILLIIVGVLLLPIGLVLIIPAIIMMWFLKKGGQVSNMQKELKEIRKMEEYKIKRDLEKRRNDAMNFTNSN